MKNLSERIIGLLKESRRVGEDDLRKALALYAKRESGTLRDVIVEMGLVTEKELVSLLSTELHIPFLNLSKYKIHADLKKMIPEKIARRHRIVPVSCIGTTLTLAMSDPFNIFAVEDIEILTKRKVECVLSTEKDVEEAMERLYARGKEDMQALADSIHLSDDDVEIVKRRDDGDAQSVLEGRPDSAPIVKVVDLLLREALKKRASDIHIEPFETRVRVRYRVDGNLEEAFEIPKKNQNAVLTRVKIMSTLDITENRLPQDGRFKIKIHEKEVDLRVSILPVHFGSKIVMRILDRDALGMGLDHLGFLPETLGAFKAAVAKPFGMILITGPTGSGKSTTLYSILNQLNTPDKNIITIEDPIEYQVRGITQIHARPEIGLDFASGLRAILRQSPDIVMVGEIRDSETADIAIKAALTGQLVLSTLHTNDASGAMTRLIDMGVEPFLIASSVVLVAAQRLCRKICPACKQKSDVPKEALDRLGVPLDKFFPKGAERVFYAGKGCPKCNHTGYLGRMGVLETLTVDDHVRDLVIQRVSSNQLKQYAVKKGMTTLRDDALKKFCLGLTTLDEVLRATSEDE